MLPSIRVFVVESAAAPDAKLFAVRHAQGYLCRDNGGNVVLGTDRADVDRQRRQLNLASVAHVVALVPESEVVDRAPAPLAAVLEAGAGALCGDATAPNISEFEKRAEGIAVTHVTALGNALWTELDMLRRQIVSVLGPGTRLPEAGHLRADGPSGYWEIFGPNGWRPLMVVGEHKGPFKVNGSDLDPTRDQVRNPSEPPQETMPDAKPDPQQASRGQGEPPTAETKPEPKRKKK